MKQFPFFLAVLAAFPAVAAGPGQNSALGSKPSFVSPTSALFVSGLPGSSPRMSFGIPPFKPGFLVPEVEPALPAHENSAGPSAGSLPLVIPYAVPGKLPLRAALDDLSVAKADDPARREYFFGARVNLSALNIALETDRTEEAPTYSVSLNWRF